VLGWGPDPSTWQVWRCRGKPSLFQGFARPPSPPTLLHYLWERVFFGLPSITNPTILPLVFRRCLPASRPEPESFPLPTSPSSLPYPAAVPKICLGGFTRSGYCRCFIVSRLGKAAHDTDNITGQLNRRLCSPDGQSRPIFRNALGESGGLPTLKACKEPLYTSSHHAVLLFKTLRAPQRLSVTEPPPLQGLSCSSFSSFHIQTCSVMKCGSAGDQLGISKSFDRCRRQS